MRRPKKKVGRFQPPLSVSRHAMLVGGNDETFRHVLFLMLLASNRLATFREAVGRMIGLSSNQYVVLLGTAHAGRRGAVTVSELAPYTLMARTHVSTQVGALIRKGLVRKEPNGKDGRSVLLSLTPKGAQAMKRIAAVRRQFNDAFFVGVARSKLLAAAEFLDQVVANSERALPLLRLAESRSARSE